MTDWSGVLREIFSYHHHDHPHPLLLEKESGFGLYQIQKEKIWFPIHFDPSFLGFVYDEIFTWKVYERGSCVIHPGEWVIDAGACEGFFSLYVLKKGANVIAFEPVPEIAQALEKTLESYIKQGRAKVFPMGLGRAREEKKDIPFLN